MQRIYVQGTDMRFNTPQAVIAWADEAAAVDLERHRRYGVDLNPFSTWGARSQWRRGYEGTTPRSYEADNAFDTIYQRGAAMWRLMQS